MRWARMRRLILAALMLAGCTTAPLAPNVTGKPLAGIWRAASGQTLSISLFSSFATQSGCTITGGMLEPLGDRLYRIDRFETGHGSDRCGPWRSGPAIAPFDGAQVRLERRGDTLVAAGPGRQVAFRWVARSPV